MMSRVGIRVTVLLLVPSLAPLLIGCSDRRSPPIAVDPGPVPAELAAGERLFNISCARCHGALALGTDTGPPLVHPYYEPNHHADGAFLRAVTAGVPSHHWDFGPMPKIEGVSREDVAAITAYVRWVQRAAGIY
jgi:mono/diheme cytochrome c family protein